ncbi:unnamed protein product [Lymnaea stagnalis]|uniref:Uncharacterized protein n=1 Tax=Lymnaea stagnalis TaxID=6523 RepID=A0AAV2IIX7_LYMST
MFSTPKDFCQRELKEFIGHKDEVNCVSYSPDFQLMVTGSDDQRVRAFSVKTKQCIVRLKGHEGAIKSVAVSECSKYIASGSFDKTARIWKTANGECIHVLKGHAKSVESVAFSPGAIYCCTGSWDRTAKLWCIQTGKCLKTFRGHGSLVQSVGFSQDCHLLASGSWDFTVRVWNLDHKAYQKIRSDLMAAQHKVDSAQTDLNSDPQGRSVSSFQSNFENEYVLEQEEKNVLSDHEMLIEVHDIVKVLLGHSGNVHAISFSRIGMLASGSWDRTIRLWNPRKGNCLRILEGHIGWVQAVSFSPDSTFVASAADDDFVKVWDILTGVCVNTLEGNTDLAQFCAFTPDGLLIASGAAVSTSQKLPKKREGEDAKTMEGKILDILNQ